MSGKTLTTTVSINGNIDASVQKAFASMTERLSAVQKAAVQASGATDKLSAVIDMQSDGLEAAKKAYTDYILSGEKSRKKAKELANNIKKLAGELDENEKNLRDAQDAAEKLAGSLKETGDAASDSESGFTVMRGAAANLVATGITALTNACINAVKSITGLAESTREYREDMAKLETSFETLGHTAQEGTAVYKELYSVFGEEDRAVEAAQQIAALADNQDEMARMVDIATGAWARWGDSLATESLMEAMNSTAKVGTVQGTLADALEWSGVNLDEFNASLEAMNSEEQRSAHIMKTLEKLYGKAADDYRENNASIIDARLANSDYTDSLAEIGEKIEPVTTAVQRGFNKILQKGLELMNKTDLAGFADKISAAFDQLAPILGTVFEQGMAIGSQLITQIAPILPTVLSLISQFGSFLGKIIPIVGQILGAIIPFIGTLIDGLAPAVMTVLGALSPVLSALSSIIDWLLPPLMSLLSVLIPIIQLVANVFSGYLSSALSIVLPIIQNIIGVFSSLIDFVKNIFLGNWSAAWESFKGIFSNAFAALGGLAKAPLNAVIGIINSAISGINAMGFEIPEWVPIVGGKKFSINIPEIPMLATGGFTNGVSIAGEAGTEAVISFDSRYRAQNLSYWAQAGQMLGADYSDYALGGSSGSSVDFGGVTFAPSITITGKTDKESIMEAIEAEYPEFLDMLEEYFLQRSVTVYA